MISTIDRVAASGDTNIEQAITNEASRSTAERESSPFRTARRQEPTLEPGWTVTSTAGIRPYDGACTTGLTRLFNRARDQSAT